MWTRPVQYLKKQTLSVHTELHMRLSVPQLELEAHGQTVEYRTINTVVEGDVVVAESLLKQRRIVAEMKDVTRSEYTHVKCKTTEVNAKLTRSVHLQ